jgi:hypothetical protein
LQFVVHQLKPISLEALKTNFQNQPQHIKILFSPFLFRIAHIFNVNATLWPAIAILIEAGVLLAVAFVLTRRIWFGKEIKKLK